MGTLSDLLNYGSASRACSNPQADDLHIPSLLAPCYAFALANAILLLAPVKIIVRFVRRRLFIPLVLLF